MIEVIKEPINSNFLYRVKQTDTIESICQKFHTTKQRLMIDNPHFTNLYCGCLLYITHFNKNIYIVQPLDTLDTIAKQLNISKEQLITQNKISKLFIGQMLEY